uniref:Uncharacterized protein n=1 Tax=Timema cristinae TaxID=61476 RepID=A0A7R9DL10_TIMCR|nr:unnamed protein product [Timema cristinae]
MVLPVVDSFLPEAEQYLPRDPEEVLKTGQYDQWRDLIRQGYQELRSFFENSAIPNILEHYGFIKSSSEGIREIIKWQYVNQVQEGDTNGLLLNLLKTNITQTHNFQVKCLRSLDELESFNTRIARFSPK